MINDTGHKYNRINADLLIPGRGSPVKDANCILDGKTIAHIGLRSDLSDEYASLSTIHAPIILPGLWDAHTN